MDRHDELYRTYSKVELCDMICELEDNSSDLENKIKELEQEVEVFERRSNEKNDIINDLEERLDRCVCSDSDSDEDLRVQFADPLDTPITEVELDNLNPSI